MKIAALIAGSLLCLFLIGNLVINNSEKDLIVRPANEIQNLPKSSSDTIKTPEQIYEEADYLLKIEVLKFEKIPLLNRMFSNPAYGSGSVIQCEKYDYCVLTAWHVVDAKMPTIFAYFKYDIPPQKLELIGGSTTYDFAILRFNDPNFKPRAVANIGKSSSLKTGTKILGMGSSALGDFWFSADGYLYAAAGSPPFLTRIKLLEIGMRPYPAIMLVKTSLFRGYSGGPLLNSKGELVGISVAVIQLDGHMIGVGVPIDDIMKEIRKDF